MSSVSVSRQGEVDLVFASEEVGGTGSAFGNSGLCDWGGGVDFPLSSTGSDWREKKMFKMFYRIKERQTLKQIGDWILSADTFVSYLHFWNWHFLSNKVAQHKRPEPKMPKCKEFFPLKFKMGHKPACRVSCNQSQALQLPTHSQVFPLLHIGLLQIPYLLSPKMTTIAESHRTSTDFWQFYIQSLFENT